MQLTQSKSKTQLQEVCTVSSIVLMLTLIGHDMVFISFAISIEIHLNHIICSTSYLVYFTCRIRKSLVCFCQEETDCYREDVVGLIKRVHI